MENAWVSRDAPAERVLGSVHFMLNRKTISRRRISPGKKSDGGAAVRMVAIDLDGTLLNDAKKVSDRTVAALAEAADAGVKVIIASARPPRSVRHIYQQLGLDTWQINYNGALIWDEPAKRVIFHRPIDPGLVRQIIDFARGEFPDVLVTCEILDKWYTDRLEQTYTTETGRLFKPNVVAPLDEFCNQPITKLLLLGDREMMTGLAGMLVGVHAEKVSMVQTDPELIQIMDKRVSKATALKMVAGHYNIPMKQVMAIGDAPNDVGMLQLAGIAVAMHNAHDIVKRVAHWVAPSNNDHGVHAALIQYGVSKAV
jgi:Cof subfamily protein (haloacid dehalogenase superfamily)